MKTNTLSKMIIVFLGAVMFFALNAAVYAETGRTNNTKKDQTTGIPCEPGTVTPDFSGRMAQRGDNGSRGGRRSDNYQGEWFEDWFDDRIDSRENSVDYGQLPGNPTDAEMLEFFRMYFMGGNAAPGSVDGSEKSGKHSGRSRDGGNMKPERRSREEDRKADMFEDWFENRIEMRKHQVDFSQLPENPTDEEMLEFFKYNFLGESSTRTESVKPDEAPINTDGAAQNVQQPPAEEPAPEEIPAEKTAPETPAEESAPETPVEENVPEEIPSEESVEEGKETA